MKNTVKRVAALLIAITLVLSISGCSGEPEAKTFSVKEMNITLTEEFTQAQIDEKTTFFSCPDYVVSVLRDDTDDLRMMGMPTDMDVASYASIVLAKNDVTADIEIYEATAEEYDYVIGYQYEQLIEGEKITYFTTVYRSSAAYWFIQFAAPLSDSEGFEQAKPKFIEWAKTVRFPVDDTRQ